MSAKRRISNEEIGKILFEAISEHTKRMETNEKHITQIENAIKNHVTEAKNIHIDVDSSKLQSSMNEIDTLMTNQLKSLKTLLNIPKMAMYVLFGLFIYIVFISGLSFYSFNKMTNEVKDYRKQVEKYEGMKSYFQSFLDNSKEGKKAFEKWKSLKKLKQGE